MSLSYYVVRLRWVPWRCTSFHSKHIVHWRIDHFNKVMALPHVITMIPFASRLRIGRGQAIKLRTCREGNGRQYWAWEVEGLSQLLSLPPYGVPELVPRFNGSCSIHFCTSYIRGGRADDSLYVRKIGTIDSKFREGLTFQIFGFRWFVGALFESTNPLPHWNWSSGAEPSVSMITTPGEHQGLLWWCSFHPLLFQSHA